MPASVTLAMSVLCSVVEMKLIESANVSIGIPRNELTVQYRGEQYNELQS
jgi:hypothetical protein